MREQSEGRPEARPGGHVAPWAVDALLGVGVTLIVSLFIAADVSSEEPDGWAYLWAVGLGGLMLVRRRYPGLVVVLSVAALFAYYASGYPPIGVAVPLAAAVFSAAECGRTVVAGIASALAIVISVAYRLAVGQDPGLVVWYELPGHALMLAGAIAFGDSVRSRREVRRRAAEIADLTAERYARRAEQQVMAERLAIARELHDSVGHALTVVDLHTQVLEELLDTGDPEVRRSLSAISDTAAATFADIRRTAASLRREASAARSPLRVRDLEAALRPLEEAGLQVHSRVRVRTELPPIVEATVYRIVQESITNVLRHARASRVEVTVEEEDGRVTVSIIDDGRGGALDAGDTVDAGDTERARGHGIAGMRERVQLLGGTFSAGLASTGFAVRAALPLEAAP